MLANHHEVRLVQLCFDFYMIEAKPENLIGDRDRGALDEEECFIDATFVMAKGGGAEIGATKRGKGMKIMAIVDRHGLPPCGQPSRSPPGAAMFRLLHDRSQAGELDR